MSPTTPLAHALAGPAGSSPVLLDGGLSTELEAAGHDVSSALWSAQLLTDDPGAVVAAHARFARAGARVLTTASYQATLPGLTAAGLTRAEAERVVTSSVDLAHRGLDRALAETGTEGWVAGSVGPYGAHLADGSEYTGAYLTGPSRVTAAQLRAHHRPHLELLAAAGADVLACETLPGAAEVEALLTELDALGAPAWVSASAVLDDDGVARTRRGEPLAQVLATAARSSSVIAVGVNCTDPAVVVPALTQTAAALADAGPAVAGTALVAYPNSGEGWDAAARTWRASTSRSSPAGEQVRAWAAAGARLVGGCCRVGPAQTALLAAGLEAPRG